MSIILFANDKIKLINERDFGNIIEVTKMALDSKDINILNVIYVLIKTNKIFELNKVSKLLNLNERDIKTRVIILVLQDLLTIKSDYAYTLTKKSAKFIFNKNKLDKLKKYILKKY